MSNKLNINKDERGLVPIVELVIVALVAAFIAIIGYRIYLVNTTKKPSTHTSQTTQSTTISGDKTQVTDEDVKKAQAAKDCSKINNDVYIGSKLAGVTMMTINLDSGTLVTKRDQTTNYNRWTRQLPTVLDDQCKVLKLSDIKSGDKLNLYFNNVQNSELLYIQKL